MLTEIQLLLGSTLNISLFALWILSALFDYSEFLYLAQLKEYRLDRFKDFMSTKQGKRFMFRYGRVVRVIVAAIALFWPLNNIPALKYILLGVLMVDVSYALYRAFAGQMRRPKQTPKIAVLFGLALLFEFTLLYLTRDWVLTFLILIMRVFIIGTLIYLLYFPTTFVKKVAIRLAEKKLKRYKKLTVVGITGSYGKSTVKEFTSQILEGKFRVMKTPKNINTEIGIALFILKNDFANADIFVVEMGAYRMGEIKLICDMVHPTIGVLTGINEQHLSLFGNIRNTQKTKYELLRSLPADGLAVVNNDSPLVREFLHEIDAKVWSYGIDEEYDPTILITDLVQKMKEKRLEGTIFSEPDQSEYSLSIPVLGRHNAWNFIAAGLVAGHLGMDHEEIAKQGSKLSLPKMTLAESKYGNCTIINDSYNSNPNGFKAALEFLGSFPSSRRRIVITRGMLELGEKSDELHELIGSEIDFVADELVIINEDFSDAMQMGVVGKYRTDILLRYERDELLKYVKSLKQTDAVILVENRLPSNVREEIFGDQSN
jgi:UDP-N-acetylmuramoyl-tripeptide--D-alanyl-D-alanine ligase